MANIFREIRLKMQISRPKLAKQLKVSEATVKRWEFGISRPRTEYYPRIMTVYNISRAELIDFLTPDLQEAG